MVATLLAHLRRQRMGALALALILSGGIALVVSGPAVAEIRPNILLIVTDDQRYDSLAVMPRTARIFARHGVTYPEAFVTTPLCCPSRASIFSGLYAHNHGVFDDGGGHFDATRTWEHDLQAAGYYTGIIGKYFNGIPTADAPYFAFTRGTPSDGREPALDLADVGTFLAHDDVHDWRPWVLELAVHSPHGPWTVQPEVPRPIPAFDPSPSFGELNLSDKDPRIAAVAATFNPAYATSQYLGQSTELEAVDETVRGTFHRLAAHDESDRTLAIFISDNGMLQGEHGLEAKRWPYLESVRVPLLMRWPGHLPEGAVRERIAANIDLAPTIDQAARVTPSYVQDGRSLLAPSARSWLLLEGPRPHPDGDTPGWDGFVSHERQYVAWHDGFVEDYNLGTDPWERRASNASDPVIEAEIASARTCSGEVCP